MGIYSQEELEQHLFSAILHCHSQNKRLLCVDYFGTALSEFDNNYDTFLSFLKILEEKRFIAIEDGHTMRATIIFGENAKEWRNSIEVANRNDEMRMQNNVTINATNVNSAIAGDVNIQISDSDIEHIIRLIKCLTENNNPRREGIISKINQILSSGNNAVSIIKMLASIV